MGGITLEVFSPKVEPYIYEIDEDGTVVLFTYIDGDFRPLFTYKPYGKTDSLPIQHIRY